MIHLALLAGGAAAACPDIEAALERATVALTDGSDPEPALADAEASLACAPATRAQAARLWLLRGTVVWLTGDTVAAEPWLAASRALSSEGFDARLGGEVREAWARAVPAGEGALRVDVPATVDGDRVRRWPHALTAGPHAVQVVEAGFGRVAHVTPGQELAVVTGATPPRRFPTFLAAAGVAAVAAGGLAGAAVLQTGAMEEAAADRDAAAVDAAYGRQQAFGYGAYALGGLAAGGVALHFVVP